MNTLRTALGIALVAVTLGATAARSADSFYVDLFHEGRRNAQVGKFDEAVRNLRIACFGFLDEPELLARGLVYLATAQAAAGNRDGYLETFDRLADIEERFGSYTEAAIPAIDRTQFQQQAVEWIPDVELLRIPAFEAVIEQAKHSDLDGLSARHLRKALRLRLEGDADNREFLWRLAELEWGDGRPKQAAPVVDRLLALEPSHGQALCLRGLIGRDQRQCAAAISGLPRCAELTSDSSLAGFLLECLAEGEEWSQVHRLAATLAPEVLASNKISRLLSELPEAPVEDGDSIGLASSAAAPATGPGTAELAVESAEGALGSPQSPGLAAEDLARIENARELLLTATQLDDLEAANAIAEQLLDSNPDSGEVRLLAAEIAYRGSRWTDAVGHFQAVALPTQERTLLLFYYAVSLYESGARLEAIPVLESVLPTIERTPFVDSYANRILRTTADFE